MAVRYVTAISTGSCRGSSCPCSTMANFRFSLHCKYYWRLWVLTSASVVLLIMCIMCKPVTPVPAGFPTSPKAPESSKLSSIREEYDSSRQPLSSLRRILDNEENPYSRPAPRSYPPPQDNVQTFGVDEHVDEHGREHERASPPSMNFHPQFKRLHSPPEHP